MKRIKTIQTFQWIKTAGANLFLVLFFLSACQKGGNDNGQETNQYMRVRVNGTDDLNITGTVGSFDPNPIIANVTVKDNGGLKANTVQIGAAFIDEEVGEQTQSLELGLQGITSPGTYDMLENDGLFLYTSKTGGTVRTRYYISGEEHGFCTITIEEISDLVRPGIGKSIKGTFSATVIIDEDGNTHTIEGDFNGGV